MDNKKVEEEGVQVDGVEKEEDGDEGERVGEEEVEKKEGGGDRREVKEDGGEEYQKSTIRRRKWRATCIYRKWVEKQK